MTLKITVESGEKDIQFPTVLQSKSGNVFLFTSEQTGICLHPQIFCYHVGEVVSNLEPVSSDTWTKCSITLSSL